MKMLRIAGVLAALSLGCGSSLACERMEKVVSVWLPIMQTTAYYVAL
jgi:NitT/TauT family transport system substrate-binding protein